jgi:hypothetical protein
MFEKVVKVLTNFHEGLDGGHFDINITIKKVLASSYWWSTLNKLMRCVKHVIYANDLHQCGEVVKDHFNLLCHLSHL